MEDTVINAMLICNKVQLSKKSDNSTTAAASFLEKQKSLQESTLGNLIKILSNFDLSKEDVAYLRWLKKRRDFFVHKYFQNGAWPGEMSIAQINSLNRTLGYLELTFHRATGKIWKILVRARLMDAVDFGRNGALLMNTDLDQILSG
jgi:hypothetical protein